MKFESATVSEIVIFKPQDGENVYFQWFKADPSDGAKGPVLSFKLLNDASSGDIIVLFDGNSTKIASEESDWPQKTALDTMSSTLIKDLDLDQDQAELCISFLDALISDEAEDLDEASFDYTWAERANDYLSFNNSVGSPSDRIQIRVKSNQFGEGANVEISGNEFLSDDIKMSMAFGISHF